MENQLLRLALAALVGFAVGLERERAKESREVGSLGGVRTYALIGFLGGLAATYGGELLLAAGFLAIAAFALWSFSRAPGATSEVAALVVYLLGWLAGSGQWQAAMFGGLLTLGLLTYRSELHRWSLGISEDELEAAVLLGLLWGVVWPLLPEGGYGPGGAIRPREIWLMVLLVAGANFLGYLFARAWREKGLYWAALAGGLVSSTAVTVSMAARARRVPAAWRSWAAAAGLASVLMYLRVLLWVGLLAPALLVRLTGPLAVWALWNLAVSLWLARKAGAGEGAIELDNPLGLRTALIFGFFYALVRLLSHLAREWLGATGVYAVAGLAGLQDLDAISLSLAGMFGRGELAMETAARALLLAALVNNGVKTAIGYAGEKRLGVALALALLPGALAAWAWLVYL